MYENQIKYDRTSVHFTFVPAIHSFIEEKKEFTSISFKAIRNALLIEPLFSFSLTYYTALNTPLFAAEQTENAIENIEPTPRIELSIITVT